MSVKTSALTEIGHGYALSSKYRRQGIVNEVVALLVRNLFNSTPANRLEICMATRNQASEKVTILCGFRREGIS
jgi:RimJ/RimL family protein N-acetyltransferase